MRSARSNTVTSWPARVSCCAAASPAGSEPDDGDLLAGQLVRRQRHDPALVERVVDDLDLDLLDGHRVLVDAEHARRLARRRAQPARELGEVVGGVQAFDGIAPAVPVDQVVPLGDEVTQRTPVVAERNPAIHAAGGLVLQHVVGEVLVDLVPVAEAQRDRPALRGLARSDLEEIRADQPLAAAMIAVSTSSPVRSASAMAASTRL